MREFLRWLAWWRPPCLLEAVIVNRIDDPRSAIRGVLWQSRGAWLVVKQAELLTAGEQPTPIDGEIVLHRTNVAFIQRLPR